MSDLTQPPTPKIQFADRKCSSCGYRHQVDAFEPDQAVRVLSENVRHRYSGMVGVVTEWRAMPKNSVWVRVQFADGKRENFDPCELEHA